MSTSDGEIRTRFDELKPGDRIEVEHTVTAGGERRRATLCGTVLRTERCRRGLPLNPNTKDRGFNDVILLELPDGELTTVTVDDSTVLRRA